MTRPSFAFMRGIIDAYKALPGNAFGGSLHQVFDHQNYRSMAVDDDYTYAMIAGDEDGAFLAALLHRFTESERREIIELESRA